MKKAERALHLFSEGYICTQAVLSTYAEQFGLDYETSLKLATAFGGGLARRAEVCGVITGSLMVIGLMHGNTDVEDTAAKEKTYLLAQELMKRFEQKFGALKCRSLLNEDISNLEGLERAREEKLFETLCPEYIRYTIQLLEEIL
ncbi:C-GCAxxG-C-C family protein [bacterium]|nr:C-GCAxxG-C-C family protein [bacterium]